MWLLPFIYTSASLIDGSVKGPYATLYFICAPFLYRFTLYGLYFTTDRSVNRRLVQRFFSAPTSSALFYSFFTSHRLFSFGCFLLSLKSLRYFIRVAILILILWWWMTMQSPFHAHKILCYFLVTFNHYYQIVRSGDLQSKIGVWPLKSNFSHQLINFLLVSRLGYLNQTIQSEPWFHIDLKFNGLQSHWLNLYLSMSNGLSLHLNVTLHVKNRSHCSIM